MTEINRMIDEMIAAGNSEEEILTAVCKQYEPYDTMPEFGEGFVDYQKCQWNKNYTASPLRPTTEAPMQPCGFGKRSGA
jgi:hypothetical protein